MLAGERPGRGTTPGTGTELIDDTHDSTAEQTDEGLGRDRPITRNLLQVLLGPFRSEPRPSHHGVVIVGGPCVAPHVTRRPARARNGLTGRRKRHTRPRRQVPSPASPSPTRGRLEVRGRLKPRRCCI
jgi:hypothetical protein